MSRRGKIPAYGSGVKIKLPKLSEAQLAAFTLGGSKALRPMLEREGWTEEQVAHVVHDLLIEGFVGGMSSMFSKVLKRSFHDSLFPSLVYKNPK